MLQGPMQSLSFTYKHSQLLVQQVHSYLDSTAAMEQLTMICPSCPDREDLNLSFLTLMLALVPILFDFLQLYQGYGTECNPKVRNNKHMLSVEQKDP